MYHNILYNDSYDFRVIRWPIGTFPYPFIERSLVPGKFTSDNLAFTTFLSQSFRSPILVNSQSINWPYFLNVDAGFP